MQTRTKENCLRWKIELRCNNYLSFHLYLHLFFTSPSSPCFRGNNLKRGFWACHSEWKKMAESLRAQIFIAPRFTRLTNLIRQEPKKQGRKEGEVCFYSESKPIKRQTQNMLWKSWSEVAHTLILLALVKKGRTKEVFFFDSIFNLITSWHMNDAHSSHNKPFSPSPQTWSHPDYIRYLYNTRRSELSCFDNTSFFYSLTSSTTSCYANFK